LSAKLISAEERAAATEQQVRSDLARMPPPSLPNGGSFSSASDLRTFGSATVNPSDDVGVQAMQVCVCVLCARRHIHKMYLRIDDRNILVNLFVDFNLTFRLFFFCAYFKCKGPPFYL
jgi:hypothetical protein